MSFKIGDKVRRVQYFNSNSKITSGEPVIISEIVESRNGVSYLSFNDGKRWYSGYFELVKEK